MLKTIPKILITIFLFIFLIQLAGVIFLLAVPEPSQAADVKFTPQVGIGDDFKKGVSKTMSGSTKDIAEYIKAIYKYALGIVGILATVVLMFGGVLWIIAGGNAERITNAKSWITAALTGLVLALTSYMILYIVNPGLVNFRVTPVTSVEEMKYKKLQGAGEECSTQKPCISNLLCLNNKCVDDCDGKTSGNSCKADTYPNGGYCAGTYLSCYKCREKTESCNTSDPDQRCCSGFTCSGFPSYECE